MRSSFLRLILHRRGTLPPNKDAAAKKQRNTNQKKKVKRKHLLKSAIAHTTGVRSSNNNNNKPSSVPVSPSQAHTSVFAIMAIQAVHSSSNIMMYNRFHHVYVRGGAGGIMVMMNDYYNHTWNGTLGPTTHRYEVYAWKGERSQSRSRLEVCPANTTSVAASSKPNINSLTFCQRTYDFVTE